MSAFAYRLRNYYWDHGWLQEIYSTAQIAEARLEHWKGEMYEALVRYCNAARRLRSLSARQRRLDAFSEFVHRHGVPSTALCDNIFLRSFLTSGRAEEVRSKLRSWSAKERACMRGNLIVLKTSASGERGVLLLQYTPHFDTFLVNFQLSEIAKHYSIVLEPSWATFPEPYWAMFSCADTPIFCEIMSQEAVDAMRGCELPIIATEMGAQDWIDPSAFKPLSGVKKEFDVVMIANFARFKRHHVLLKAMRRIRPQRIRLALIGRTWERTRAEMEKEIAEYGLQEDCVIFQGLDGAGVNEVLNRSKVNVLLSKAEGGNRGLMEGFAANVPCVVYRDIVGPRPGDINAMTGVFATDEELPEVLLKTIANYETFTPRAWFLANSGCELANRKLNDLIRAECLRRGERWTTDIAEKKNQLELWYVNESSRTHLQPAWDELENSLATL